MRIEDVVAIWVTNYPKVYELRSTAHEWFRDKESAMYRFWAHASFPELVLPIEDYEKLKEEVELYLSGEPFKSQIAVLKKLHKFATEACELIESLKALNRHMGLVLDAGVYRWQLIDFLTSSCKEISANKKAQAVNVDG